MFRRTLFPLAGLAAICAAGCSAPGACVGWSFQVGKPSTVQAQTVLGPTVQTYAGQGIAGSAIASDVALIAKDALVGAAASALPMPRLAMTPPVAPQSSCTMEDICRKLDALTLSISRIPRSAPMPPEE